MNEYEKGYRDGFLQAWDYVIQNANVHKHQFKSLYDMIKQKQEG